MHLTVENLTCRYGARTALRELSLAVGRGEFLAVVGPNGSGKSTLVRAITGVLQPAAGRVLLAGRDLSRIPDRQRAAQMAVLAQETAISFDFTVQEVVQMGRLPHQRWHEGERPADAAAVRRALALTGTTAFGGRLVTELSGGERQRVLLARALAQEPQMLILDEPTAHLDIAYQTDLLELTRALGRAHRLTVIAVLHDLNLAAQYADRILMLKEGRSFAEGAPSTVVTERNVTAVYGTPVRVIPHPENGVPHVILLSGGRAELTLLAD